MKKKDNFIEHPIVIDSEKCIGCGLCSEDCVGLNIMLEDGKAVIKSNNCIKCGHCEAICPQNAIHILGYEDEIEEYEEQYRLDPDELMKAIKTRRSIRKFTDQPVPQEVVDMIIEAGRQAPTGTNAQGTKYIVLRRKKAECEQAAVDIFRKILKFVSKFSSRFGGMNISEDFFFKKAPLVILILGNDKVSASLAAQNMAFMAEANGLGVLFSGFYTICFNMSGRIRKMMGVKKGPKAVTTLVLGYPAVKYRRTAHRKTAQVLDI